MQWFDSLRQSVFGVSQSTRADPRVFTDNTRYNAPVTFEESLNLSPFRSAIDIIVRSLVHLDITAKDKEGNEIEHIAQTRLLSRRPNPWQSRSVFLTQVIEQYIVNGNVFIYDDGINLICLDSRAEYITIRANEFGLPIYTVIETVSGLPGGRGMEYDTTNMIHIQRNASRGIWGIGALTELGPELLILKLTNERYQTILTDNNRQLVFKSGGTASSEDERITSLTEGLKIPGKKLITMDKEDSLELIPQPSGIDDKLLETIDLAQRKITAYFGMPADFLNAGNGSKYNNLRQSNSGFASTTLEPLESALTEAFENHFKMPEGTRLEFKIEDFIRGDIETHTRLTINKLEKGLISINTARIELGYPRVDEDRYDELPEIGTNIIEPVSTGGADGPDGADNIPEEDGDEDEEPSI